MVLLQSPIVKGDKKQAVLDAVLKGHVGSLTTSYLQILVQKGREGLVVDMVKDKLNFGAFATFNRQP